MSFFKPGKMPKPQSFNYIPRYYAPRKEELERRIKAQQSTGTGNMEALKTRITTNLRHRITDSKDFRRRKVVKSNLTIIGIILVLLWILYEFMMRYMHRIKDFTE